MANVCPFCTAPLPAEAVTCPVCGASLTTPALPVGTRIAGQYRVEEVLGRGGFGITYLALDETLDHRVAIKELFPDASTRHGLEVIPPPGVDFASQQHKFLEEARVVQRFTHQNIVRVYGTFSANGTPYIVMEALTGSTLTSDVTSNGAFPEASVLEMARQLCAALVVVHEAGLLHRDIKPDNVFLTSDARVVLIDFGSARGFAAGQVKRLTRLLTPGYAAPEQYASQAAFGAYTDVYGLAATLFYALEGRMPPMATELMLGETLKFEKAGTLRAGLEAGLKIKIGERPQTMRAFLEALEQPVRASTAHRVLASTFTSSKVYIKGWHFEDELFYRGLNQYFYREIKAIKIVKSNPNFLPLIQNEGLHGSLFFSIILGLIFTFLGIRSGYVWLSLIGILLILLGSSTFFQRKSSITASWLKRSAAISS